jgi:hypothetical protein
MILRKLVDEAKALWEMSSAVANNTPKELTALDRAKIRTEVMYRLFRTVTIRQNIIRGRFELMAHAKALEAKGVSFEEEDEVEEQCPFDCENCQPDDDVFVDPNETFTKPPVQFEN